MGGGSDRHLSCISCSFCFKLVNLYGVGVSYNYGKRLVGECSLDVVGSRTVVRCNFDF